MQVEDIDGQAMAQRCRKEDRDADRRSCCMTVCTEMLLQRRWVETAVIDHLLSRSSHRALSVVEGIVFAHVKMTMCD